MSFIKKIKFGLFFFFPILVFKSFGETIVSDTATYASPLNIPLYLAGNFGEIRGNHFHSGIDFKTENVSGKKVFAVADGYVSRIFISPFGFGHALYITHPELGTVSVYGHLSRFSGEIARYALQQQYASRSFSIDKYLQAGVFPVKKGDLIAYSGNTGSSGGPHLHFEIRDGASQCPMNILAQGVYKIQDNIKPKILSVAIVEVDTLGGVPQHKALSKINTVPTEKNGVYKMNQDTLSIRKPSYFAIEVTDRKDGVPNNTFGITRMKVTRNGKPYFGFNIDKISFATTRYVNTLLLFPETQNTRNDIFRTYISPNNRLDFYIDVAQRGIIKPQTIKETETISIQIWDDTGNEASVCFHIKADAQYNTTPVADHTEGIPVWWLKGYTYTDSLYRVQIPPRALYESLLLKTHLNSKMSSDTFSPAITIADESTMLQKPVIIAIKGDKVPLELHSKALIVRKNKQGKETSIGGKWNDSYLEASSSSFGIFQITIDTIPPRIVPGNITSNSITCKATDDLSGIATWKATIDGKWALMRYEPKTASFTHLFSDGIIEKGGSHELIFTVTDGRGNKSSYKQTFNW